MQRPGGCGERRHETVAVLECAGELDRSLSRGVRLLVAAEQRQVRSSYRAIAALGVGIGVREPDVTLCKQHLGALARSDHELREDRVLMRQERIERLGDDPVP